MLVPDERGLYHCENDDYSTDNVFAYMQHADIEFDWMIKLDRKYSFNMFTFLNQLTWYLAEREYAEAWYSVQSVALLFLNSTGEDFEEFLKEAEVISGMDDMFVEIEQYLKEKNEKEKD